MSYIEVTEPQSNPFAPLTSELVKQLRDNPIAIAEGAPGAPRVQARALGGLILPTFSANSNDWAGLVDLAEYNELTIYAFGGGSAGPLNTLNALEIRFSVNNGSSWGSAITLLSLPPDTTFTDNFTLRVNLDTGQNTRFFSSLAVASGTFSLPPGTVNGFQIISRGVGLRGSAIVTGGRV